MASVSPPLAHRESISLAPMHFCVACVTLGDIQSAFACAPAFLVASLGAVDVTAAAALTSTFLLCFTVTTDVAHCVVRLASSCPLVWAPLSAPLAPLLSLVPLSGSHSPFGSRRGGDIFCNPFCHLTSLYLSGRGSALCHVWPPSRPLSPSASLSIPLAPMHFSMACVALGDIHVRICSDPLAPLSPPSRPHPPPLAPSRPPIHTNECNGSRGAG